MGSNAKVPRRPYKPDPIEAWLAEGITRPMTGKTRAQKRRLRSAEVWEQRDGSKVFISDMTDRHLLFAITYVRAKLAELMLAGRIEDESEKHNAALAPWIQLAKVNGMEAQLKSFERERRRRGI